MGKYKVNATAIFNFFKKKEKRSSPENPSTSLQNPSEWLTDWMGGAPVAGVKVNEKTALSISAVWACVGFIADTLSSSLISVLEKRDGVWWPTDHPLEDFLNVECSQNSSALDLKKVVQHNMSMRGNGYARIYRDNAGRPVELEYLTGARPYLVDRAVWYKVDGEKLPLSSMDVIHVKGFTSDGITGISPVTALKESIAPALAARDSNNAFFANGANLSGAITVPGQLKPEARLALANSWNNQHQGVNKRGKTGILDRGMDYKPLGVSPSDALIIDVLNFGVEDIARAYRMPLPMVQAAMSKIYNTAEDANRFFHEHTMTAILDQWATELNRKLILPSEKGRYKITFNANPLTRGDSEAQSKLIQTLRNATAISPNEIRSLYNLPPREGGDSYDLPLASNIKLDSNETEAE